MANMSVYDLYDENHEDFVNFKMDILINSQQNVSIFQIEIGYQTKFRDVFQFAKEALEKYNKSIISDDNHHFLYINNKGEEEQLFYEDWNTCVKDLDILSFEKFASFRSSISEQICSFRTMKLEQTHGNLDTNLYKLEKMIGLKKDFMVAVIPKDELSLFEDSSRKLLVDASKEYDAKSLEEKLLIEHPIEINNSKTEPKSYTIQISVAMDQSECNSRKYGTLNNESHRKGVRINSTDIIPTVMSKVVSKFNERPEYSLHEDDYILKISGREEYLVSLKSIPIIKFQYINLCVQRNMPPLLVLVSKLSLNQMYKVKSTRTVVSKIISSTTTNENEFRSSYLEEYEYIYVHDLWKHFIKSSNLNSMDDETDSLNSNFSPMNNSLNYVLDNLEASDFLYEVKIVKIELPPSIILKDQKVVIIAGLYHGVKSLCELQYREWSQDSSCCAIVFTLPLWNLPRMTRFCFTLAVVKQTIALKDIANNTQKKFIGWGNSMIYDHKGILKSDEIQYRLWSSVKPNLNPTGSVYSNPDGQLIAPLLAIQFVPKLSKFKKIVYPAKEKLILEGGCLFNNAHTNEPSRESEKEDIKKYLQADFSDDAMQEQEILWKYRYYIRNTYQDSLPKILNSKPWNSFENISMMHHVMCGWPIDKDIIIALELLGSNFPDCDTRMMAVDSLSRIDWQEISLYLLQICQCLKYESYLNSNFIQWLLKIMISNAKIAQTIFYFMKVELSTCEWCKVLFATILYNYLHYSRTRCDSLLRQYYATNELGQQNKILLQKASLEGDRKSQALDKFQHALNSDESKRLFNDLTCPLDCNIKLKTLDSLQCKFMDSKMRPIRLTWKVSTEFATDYMIIYKNGDDLRQDSLVLQIMHIMDTIWQRKDLDLKLLPYDVLACSKTEGYIQVVKNAETIANISKKSNNVSNWLKEANTDKEMEIVVKNFTRSLAAYCVATFILGIGDRHSDNIMLTKNGHFFHIDFGHVLGNFKRIMGGMVSREWTKFILVQEFLDVVENEEDFKNLCCDGYIAIRDHSNLIFSLFKAMVNAGIPEISSMDDLNYLKETLQIGKGDEEARLYFQNVYSDTRKKELFITMNWQAHNMRRNNT